MLRTSMLDVMKQDYIYTAKSKGLNKTEIVKRHMIRNSLLPLVTSFGPMCAGVLTGNFVVEKMIYRNIRIFIHKISGKEA